MCLLSVLVVLFIFKVWQIYRETRFWTYVDEKLKMAKKQTLTREIRDDKKINTLSNSLIYFRWFISVQFSCNIYVLPILRGDEKVRVTKASFWDLEERCNRREDALFHYVITLYKFYGSARQRRLGRDNITAFRSSVIGVRPRKRYNAARGNFIFVYVGPVRKQHDKNVVYGWGEENWWAKKGPDCRRTRLRLSVLYEFYDVVCDCRDSVERQCEDSERRTDRPTDRQRE